MKIARRISLAALSAIGLAASAHATAAFDPDPTFTVLPPLPYCGNAIASTSDSIIYVGTDGANGFGVARMRKDGSRDASWGIDGNVTLPRPANSVVSVLPSGFLSLPDGGVIVVGQSLVKITRAGTIDTSYGSQGVSDELRDGGEGSGYIESYALQPDGSVVVLARGYNGGPLPAFTRITAHGRRDASFGVNGVLALPFDVPAVYAWSVQPNGSVEYMTYTSNTGAALRRAPIFLFPGDFGFVPNGRMIPAAGLARWMSPNAQVLADGGLLVAASACRDGSRCFDPVVAITKHKSDGTRDFGYGVAGQQIVSAYTGLIPYPGFVGPRMLSLAPGGSATALVSGSYSSGGWFPAAHDSRTVAFRLRADGSLDPSFENGKVLSYSKAVQIDDGRLVVTGAGGCLQRLTADVVRMNVPMAEFYQPQLDQYFITAEGMETGILDADDNPSTRWLRTGYDFGAWLAFELPGAKRVCRFYGDKVAGPNSHFYTLEGAECDGLRALEAATPLGQPAWRFEGYAFSAVDPVNGACPTNLTPIYRAYNLGFEHGRAPNHRYTTDISVYEAMIAKGWTGEGVKFCTPPASSNLG